MPVLLLTLALSAWASHRTPHFSHKLHVGQGVDCTACHPKIEQSTQASDYNYPKMQTECRACHGEWMDKNQCTHCHYDPVDPTTQAPFENPAWNFMFNHQKHVVENKIACKICHTNVDKADYGVLVAIPNMAFCLTCHNGKKAPSACTTCHTKVPWPQSHDASWKKNHGVRARADEASCKTCHPKEDFCVTCHRAGSERPVNHDRNFVNTHWQWAKGKEADCATCHDFRTFCQPCHASRQGIMPHSHVSFDWVPSEHIREAREDLDRCAACHDTKSSTCLRCHKNK